MAKVFRYSKRQPFQMKEPVYVKQWGSGIVLGFSDWKVQVFNADFGASGATIYADYHRVQRIG